MSDHHSHAAPHVHGPACAHAVLSLAEGLCEERGQRLTPMRRRVLEAVATARGPIGAYDVIEKLATGGEGRPSPISVYRSLDFLVRERLVHKIASLNAFLACNHSHEADTPVVFLLCESCGEVRELADEAIAASLAAATSAAGFAIRQPVLELNGVCGPCEAARVPAPLGSMTA